MRNVVNNGNAQRTRFVTPFCLGKVSTENVKAVQGLVPFQRARGGRKAVVIHEFMLKLDIKTKVGGHQNLRAGFGYLGCRLTRHRPAYYKLIVSKISGVLSIINSEGRMFMKSNWI